MGSVAAILEIVVYEVLRTSPGGEKLNMHTGGVIYDPIDTIQMIRLPYT